MSCKKVEVINLFPNEKREKPTKKPYKPLTGRQYLDIEFNIGWHEFAISQAMLALEKGNATPKETAEMVIKRLESIIRYKRKLDCFDLDIKADRETIKQIKNLIHG